MFTGIIEEIGTVRSVGLRGASGSIVIRAHRVLEGTRTGDSISVNGVCLTVTRLEDGGFAADVMAETLRRSALARLRPGAQVNLERAISVGGRLGGHILTGHIDGTGIIRSMRREGNAVWLCVRATPEILRLACPKGSIAIDGVSLTVASLTQQDLRVSIIPHTGLATTLLGAHPGTTVNLENDILAKYVARILPSALAENPDGSTDAIAAPAAQAAPAQAPADDIAALLSCL